MAERPIPISILILTLNEQENLPKLLDSLDGFEDIHVLDSFSTDRTCDIARERGCNVVQRKFDNWAGHQNWAMENVPYRHEWVMYLDADERMTDALRDEITAIATGPEPEHKAYFCRPMNFFRGRWIKRAFPPIYILRFFRPKYTRFVRPVHPQPDVDGSIGYLDAMFEHYNFSKGLDDWFAKHNRYSTVEADEGVKVLEEGGASFAELFRGDKPARRRALKRFSFRLPCRGWLKFFYLYVVRRGFLDGAPGLAYCRLQAMYETMIAFKLRERMPGGQS